MYCEKPNIIIDKTLYRKITFGRKLVFTDGTSLYPFRGSVPSPASVGATYDNYKNWSLLTEDGELIPVYIPVPCGHCLLCREKKGKEWSTRAYCETAAATYPPIFVTLTYSDGYIPHDGVSKRDLQLFLKRFRENWYRKYENRLNLRYFAVSEYGSKFGRPHYHLLLWNIPHQGKDDLLGLQKIRNVVSRSWSEQCSFKWYASLPRKGYDFLQYKEDGKFYTLFGRIDVTPDNGKSSGYCMKYMRKPKDVPLTWSQPTFYLSSRRNGGLGVPYLNQHMEDFRQNPAMFKIPVSFKLSCEVKEYGLPRVFKEKLFPSLSCVLPFHIRASIERFESMYKILEDSQDSFFAMLVAMRESLRQHYGRCYDFINRSREWNKLDSLYPTPRGYVSEHEKSIIWREIRYIFVQLYEFQPNTNALERFIGLKDKRQELLSRMKIPDVDISAERYKIQKRISLGRIREKL